MHARSHGRPLASVVLLLLLVAAPACRSARAPGATTRPRNLLLVVIDTLRRDHLATYGYDRLTAPTINRLAREGAVFEGLAPTSWTKPSVASILTGLHPLRHRAIGGDALPSEATTLAELLHARGYRTVGVSTNPQVSKMLGFGQGFDELALLQDAGYGPRPSPADTNREVLARLDSLHAPFFLYVHYLDPHLPYDPPRTWDDRPLPADLAARRPITIEQVEQFHFMRRPPEFMQAAVDLYDGEIRDVDGRLGEVLRALDRRGLLAETLLVITADHGEEFQEHGRMGHGKSLYHEVTEVPLIFHGAGVSPGVRHGRASLLDVVPSVAALLGASESLGHLDGVDLSRNIRTGKRYRDDGREYVLSLELRDANGIGGLAILHGTRKLVLGRRPYRKELYDLSRDPGEQHPLPFDTTTRREIATLAGRLSRAYDSLTAEALPPTPANLSSDTREALAALGYVSGSGVEAARLPTTIRPADAEPLGLQGWEETGPAAACLNTVDAAATVQLLAGWHAAVSGGRWIEPIATAALGRPEGRGPWQIELRGRQPHRGTARLRLWVGERRIAERSFGSGPFSWRAPLPDPPASWPLLIKIERRPPFPSDSRPRGVWISSLCLRAGHASAAEGTQREGQQVRP